MDLLGAARRIQADDLDQHGVEEVRDRRVVEREMAVLADPGADDVDRLGTEDLLVGQAGPQRPIALLSGDQPESGRIEADQSEQAFLEVAAERGPMIGGEPEVFIHVKAEHTRPVDIPGRHQARQELVLTGSGREHHVGPPGVFLPAPDRLADGQSRGPSRGRAILVDPNLE